MKVSVIIPTYNQAAYICDAIDSVLAQTFNDYEIIVIDDGSTDDTSSILEKYASKIRYLYTENHGIAHARNTGMRAAQGEYIAYLDSDDRYKPHKLGLQAHFLDTHPEIGMAYTEFSAFDNSGFYDEWHLKKYHSSAYRRANINYDDIFSDEILLSNMPYADKILLHDNPDWLNRKIYIGNIFDAYLLNTIVFTNSIMFRRDLLSVTGLQDTRYSLFEDLEFVLRICKASKVAFIDVPCYELRYHPDQISTTEGQRGAYITIKKQMALLRVLKQHAFVSDVYYKKNRHKIDRNFARLNRAVAVPLLGFNHGTKHQNHYYPRRARKYLRCCKKYGYPEYYLWLLSFTPHMLRRIGFKFISLKKRINDILK